MHAVSVSGLKHNPAEALRQARSSPVVVLNRNNPDAVLIGLEEGGLLQAPGVRADLAKRRTRRERFLDEMEKLVPA